MCMGGCIVFFNKLSKNLRYMIIGLNIFYNVEFSFYYYTIVRKIMLFTKIVYVIL